VTSTPHTSRGGNRLDASDEMVCQESRRMDGGEFDRVADFRNGRQAGRSVSLLPGTQTGFDSRALCLPELRLDHGRVGADTQSVGRIPAQDGFAPCYATAWRIGRVSTISTRSRRQRLTNALPRRPSGSRVDDDRARGLKIFLIPERRVSPAWRNYASRWSLMGVSHAAQDAVRPGGRPRKSGGNGAGSASGIS